MLVVLFCLVYVYMICKTVLVTVVDWLVAAAAPLLLVNRPYEVTAGTRVGID